MTRKKNGSREKGESSRTSFFDLHPDIKRIILGIVFLACAIFTLLAPFHQGGPVGDFIFSIFSLLFGIGYYLLPIVFFVFSFYFFAPTTNRFFGVTILTSLLFVFAALGFIHIVSPDRGGLVGVIIGSLETPFGKPASLLITLTVFLISLLMTLNRPLSFLNVFSFFQSKERRDSSRLTIKMPMDAPHQIAKPQKDLGEGKVVEEDRKDFKPAKAEELSIRAYGDGKKISLEPVREIKDYVPPPLSLLSSAVEKPTIGDLRANANVIKRTLESFGISVEMDEINVGPTVTRYTLKPAEGVKLSRITALSQDLALALAAHPIRIEAPIPGKSLVGIEVPNKAAAIVRLGNLLQYEEFQKASTLAFALGRNVSGDPVFADITKMPHLLIAGATGSGKSITLHAVIISLLYKNSPQTLQFVLVDPKRVELSIYNGIPHLVAPVITANKRAINALRWAVHTMDERYETLLAAGVRDIRSYNKNHKDTPLPYVVIVIDELADLMTTYGRDVEGLIIRLAQMARATGIHLIVSTQRPSVEVITGLIKANITNRIALQVASQIDSRTILDTAGAEKLLGHGDLLFTSTEASKLQRVQGAYISEDELKKVIDFIREKNQSLKNEEQNFDSHSESGIEGASDSRGEVDFDKFAGEGDSDEELYEQVVQAVREAGKASTSLLQRRFKLGYARAARLMDVLEDRGVVGPSKGAKPREVYVDSTAPHSDSTDTSETSY